MTELVDSIMTKGTVSMERDEFKTAFLNSEFVKNTLLPMRSKFVEDIKKQKQVNMERLAVRTLLRRLFLEMQRNAVKIGGERRAMREKGEDPGPLFPERA